MELVVDARNALGECILWCERTEQLLWTDILGRTLWSYRPATGATARWDMPERLASFALTPNGRRLLLGLESRLAWLDWDDGSITTIVEVEADQPSTRINDGRCDRQGRFVFGTMNEGPGRAPIGHFYRLDHALRLERLALPPVAIANSICFSPDGKRMYYCDSLGGAIHRCDYGEQLGPQRLFACLPEGSGEPDGSAIDNDGYLWNAQWGAGKVVRYAPDGKVERELAMPVTQPTCLAFGGPQLRQLFITSALVDLQAPEPGAGGVFRATPAGVAGVAESRFGETAPLAC
jgi:L-arabinonolactonase